MGASVADPANRSSEDANAILDSLRSSDPATRELLFERLYKELKSIASNRLRGSNQSLHTTELVHEAFLKLVGSEKSTYSDRTHFCAVAARAMRQILIDRARGKRRLKRGGRERPVRLADSDVVVLDSEVDVLSLDEALSELARFDDRLARIVELRAFGGLTVDEVAAVLEVSPRSVDSHWRLARAWLRRFLSPSTPSPPSKADRAGSEPSSRDANPGDR